MNNKKHYRQNIAPFIVSLVIQESPNSSPTVIEMESTSYSDLSSSLNCKENVPPPFGMKTRSQQQRHAHHNTPLSTRVSTSTVSASTLASIGSTVHSIIAPPGGLPLVPVQDKPGCAGRKGLSSTTNSSTSSKQFVPMLATAGTQGQLFLYTSVNNISQPAANPSPLPPLSWADSSSLWQQMRFKDTSQVAPETELRLRHPYIMPSMRTILLDWMLEVLLVIYIYKQAIFEKGKF